MSVWFLAAAVLVAWLVFRKRRRTEGTELVRYREQAEAYAATMRELAAERIRARTLTGDELAAVLAGIERTETARRKAETNLTRWRDQLSRGGYDVGAPLPTHDDAEDAAWLREGEREVERLLTGRPPV